jgi:hypothetical protein
VTSVGFYTRVPNAWDRDAEHGLVGQPTVPASPGRPTRHEPASHSRTQHVASPHGPDLKVQALFNPIRTGRETDSVLIYGTPKPQAMDRLECHGRRKS